MTSIERFFEHAMAHADMRFVACRTGSLDVIRPETV
jgi:hypothetical protein